VEYRFASTVVAVDSSPAQTFGTTNPGVRKNRMGLAKLSNAFWGDEKSAFFNTCRVSSVHPLSPGLSISVCGFVEGGF